MERLYGEPALCQTFSVGVTDVRVLFPSQPFARGDQSVVLPLKRRASLT